MILNSPPISGSLTVTGNIIASGSITLSGSVASASYAASASNALAAQTASYVLTAQTASFVANAQSASNAVAAQTASFANAFTVASTLTAQTLVVQTITSSVDFVTGSTRFGSSLSTSTHQFTGSVSITGSLSGVGATFSGNVTSDDLILTAGTLFGTGNTGFSNRLSDTTLYLQMPASGFNITDNALNTKFILSSAGAATFSGNLSVTDTAYFGGQSKIFSRITADATTVGKITDSGLHIWNTTNVGSLSQITFGYTNGSTTNASVYLGLITTNGVGSGYGDFVLGTAPSANAQCVERLKITSAGAATFSSTVQANGAFIRQFAGTGYFADFAYNGTTYNFGSGEATDNVDFKIAGGGTFTTGGNFRWFTQAGGATPLQALRITPSGNLEIGTSSKASFSYLALINDANTNGGVIAIARTAGQFLTAAGAGDMIIGNSTGENILFGNGQTGTTEYMRITSGGALLINSTSVVGSDSRLNMHGPNAGPTFSNDTSGQQNLLCWNKGTSGDNLWIEFHMGSTLATRGSIDYNRASNVTRYNTSSDANLKNIIGDSNLEKSIEILNSTKIKEFSWKEDESNKTQIGVIAQELYETYKGAVSVGSDESLLGTEDYKSWKVDKTAFTFHLIAGWQKHEQLIQELKAQNDDLQSQINELKAQ
jgi:hypothetical protein